MNKVNVQCRAVALMVAVWFFIIISGFTYHTTDPYFSYFGEKLTTESVSTFPLSLKEIGTEAFSGTLLTTLVFNAGLEIIEPYAFNNIATLESVYFPESLKRIDEHAFPARVAVFCVKGSYAEQWAKVNDYSFSVVDIWNTKMIRVVILRLLLSCFIIIEISVEKTENKLKRMQKLLISMRPQDRIELYPIDYRFP